MVCFRACAGNEVEMGQVAPAGEPVWLRDQLRDDWQWRLAVHRGEQTCRWFRNTHYRGVRHCPERGQHWSSSRQHFGGLQRGLEYGFTSGLNPHKTSLICLWRMTVYDCVLIEWLTENYKTNVPHLTCETSFILLFVILIQYFIIT